ncbi:NigD1/NigD2 family lipoprotein [Phocaeicola sp.]
MRGVQKLIYLFFLPVLITACSDDDYVYPDVLTEITSLKTDGTGTIRSLITDEGVEWSVQTRSGIDGLVADSIYRTITMYAPVDTEPATREVMLYSTQLTVSPVPLPIEKFREPKTDPVELQSIWRGGNYLNLIVVAKVKDQSHAYHFMENGITQNQDGTRTLELTLYHDRNNDIEGFDRKVYLSVPLWAYADVLQKGDKIVFNLNTYKEGMTSRTFTY